jgi:hypothetical protein
MTSKKLYRDYAVDPEAVSFIIGKEGCNIKNITTSVGKGAFIRYTREENKFVCSCYNKSGLDTIYNELQALNQQFEHNRKKYASFTFVNRLVDHNTVTVIIKTLKSFSNSPFVEYKGEGTFVLSNYKQDILNDMVKTIREYDQPNSTVGFPSWKLVSDYIDTHIGESEVDRPKQYKLDSFVVSDNDNILVDIDNYLDNRELERIIDLDVNDIDYIMAVTNVV